jgi:CRP/FNR family cyclic AMP-dependent transcriptional regulator
MDSLVRVLEVDPDLGQGLDQQGFAVAKRELVAETLTVARGVWELDPAWAATGAVLGLLILAGVLARDLVIGRRRSLEILGPGDMVRPWPSDRHPGAVDVDVRFSALEPVRFAALDARFATHAARFPGVMNQVTGRVMGRATSASLRLIVHQVVRIDDRVLVSLWGLAERFGRVTPEGVVLPLAINHSMMARFVGAQRPTVSQAVGELTRRGEVQRLDHGGWLLKGAFPAHILPGIRLAR